MNKIFLALSIACFVLSACSPAAQAVHTPVVNRSVQSSPLAAILSSNGFDFSPICESPCFAYERMSPRMVANLQDNGNFIIHVFKDAGGVLDVQILYLVITQAYGQDLTNWIAEHLDASLRADQTGSVGNYDIWMRVYEDKGIITITPKG